MSSVVSLTLCLDIQSKINPITSKIYANGPPTGDDNESGDSQWVAKDEAEL